MKVSQQLVRGLKMKMMSCNSHYYLHYLDELVNSYDNTYHRSISKIPIYTDYSTLSEEFKSNHKTSKFKVENRVRITNYKNIFSKS